ncbi:DnaJ domain-containing protein [Methylobacterium sp. WL116]|uniref:DnaJ domain-containing protein n=1 Tax=Methylobacterium sp. WL116 TaxID=2603889 RepID=UPI0011CA3090|nr:DnaJ domain-containing protein [Methylobacterium sp. WL116]TXM95373.1 J domain-containing protein [Methylobacterium sp. WL116]
MTIEEAYIELGLAQNATPNAIKAAYRARAKATHPDINGRGVNAGEEFRRVQTAYEVLRLHRRDTPLNQISEDIFADKYDYLFDEIMASCNAEETIVTFRKEDNGKQHKDELVTPSKSYHFENSLDERLDLDSVRILIEAESKKIIFGMSIDMIQKIKNPHLRAAALLMTDMGELCRQGYGGDIAALAVGVNVPIAGRMGQLAFDTYGLAANANTPAKQRAYAKKLKAHTRDLIGFGQLAMAEQAFELLQQHSDDKHQMA